MCKLSYELKGLCSRSRVGSASTRAHRANRLKLIARQLKAGGYKLQSAFSLKPKHVNYLLQHWQQDDLNTGTIKNRLSDLRWWADAVRKPGMIPADNEALGVGSRETTGNRSQALDTAKLERLPCPKMKLSLRLQAAFGLRVEESLYFRPQTAHRGDYIALQGHWNKGGRARVIPITTDAQRQLIDEAKVLAGNNSLIANHQSFIQGKKALENQALKAGITNMHGHRYHYAQNRYRQLTDFACPYQGGKSFQSLSKEQQQADRQARKQISQELGHNRISIAKVYLG